MHPTFVASLSCTSYSASSSGVAVGSGTLSSLSRIYYLSSYRVTILMFLIQSVNLDPSKMTLPQRFMREKEPVGFEPGVALLEDIWKEENKFSLDIRIVLNKTPKCNIKARIQSQYIITQKRDAIIQAITYLKGRWITIHQFPPWKRNINY